MISICRTIQHQIAVASAHPIVRTAKHTPVTDHLTHCRQFQIQKIHSRIKPVDGYCYKCQKSEKQIAVLYVHQFMFHHISTLPGIVQSAFGKHNNGEDHSESHGTLARSGTHKFNLSSYPQLFPDLEKLFLPVLTRQLTGSLPAYPPELHIFYQLTYH